MAAIDGAATWTIDSGQAANASTAHCRRSSAAALSEARGRGRRGPRPGSTHAPRAGTEVPRRSAARAAAGVLRAVTGEDLVGKLVRRFSDPSALQSTERKE